MKEKIYIFDLDHTLLNARNLREDLGIIIENNRNIESEKIWKIFSSKSGEIENFFRNNIKNYLFPNVLEKIRKIRHKKILLSYGKKEFQKSKIDFLGIKDCFDQIIITEVHKIKTIEKIAQDNKDKEIFFLNDNYNKRFSENKDISEKIPRIRILEVDNYDEDENKKLENILDKV